MLDDERFVSVRCDMCAFGLSHDGVPIKKPTRILTTATAVAEELDVACSCGQDHFSLVGAGPVTKQAGAYTPAFAEAFARGLQKQRWKERPVGIPVLGMTVTAYPVRDEVLDPRPIDDTADATASSKRARTNDLVPAGAMDDDADLVPAGSPDDDDDLFEPSVTQEEQQQEEQQPPPEQQEEQQQEQQEEQHQQRQQQ